MIKQNEIETLDHGKIKQVITMLIHTRNEHPDMQDDKLI